VTGDHIRRLIAAERERLARDDRALREAGRKPRTFVLVNRIFAACGSIFTFALDENLIPLPPMPRMRRGSGMLPPENAKSRTFADEEIAAFWNRVDDTAMDARTRAALKLVLLTGMRPGEILGLRRRDVDLSATFVDRRGGLSACGETVSLSYAPQRTAANASRRCRNRLVY
jgi:integrase